MHYFINKDQTGLKSRRYIGDNKSLHYTETHNISRVLFRIDIKKAFDTISCSFIQKLYISLDLVLILNDGYMLFLQVLNRVLF